MTTQHTSLYITIFAITFLFTACQMHKYSTIKEASIEAANNGLEQKLVKPDGYSPRIIWVKPHRMDQAISNATK